MLLQTAKMVHDLILQQIVSGEEVLKELTLILEFLTLMPRQTEVPNSLPATESIWRVNICSDKGRVVSKVDDPFSLARSKALLSDLTEGWKAHQRPWSSSFYSLGGQKSWIPTAWQ